ncbi:hypothetical protein [Devosia sp. XK-2]|jgi:hypothetical protein|uniref:hypothetical protein n=1 Tax=Devosia sp. XK-2 TaxID=3126689 RepID=UPI0030D47785
MKSQMQAINRQWHEEHKMPPNARMDERIDWHMAHAAQCGCRPIPPSVLKAMEQRGLLVPTPRSLR